MSIFAQVTTITTIVVISLPRKIVSKLASVLQYSHENSLGVKLLHKSGHKEERKYTAPFRYKNLTFCSSQPLWWKKETKKHKRQTKTKQVMDEQSTSYKLSCTSKVKSV